MAATPRVLVVGENAFSFHRFEERKMSFISILTDVTDVETTTRKNAFTELGGYDVVVDDTTDSTLSDAQLNGLTEFVDDGGGYVGIHAAADLTTTPDENREDPVTELRELLGGHFLTHPDTGIFGVELDEHPITAGVKDFELYDEPYQVAWDDDVSVHGRMDHPDLGEYPILWTKAYGSGRVSYLSLGHTNEALGTEEFRDLLRNAVIWTTNTDHRG